MQLGDDGYEPDGHQLTPTELQDRIYALQHEVFILRHQIATTMTLAHRAIEERDRAIAERNLFAHMKGSWEP